MPGPSNRLVCHYASLLMTLIESRCLVGHLSTLHKHRVCADTEILKPVEVCIDGAEKVAFIYHSEHESFG